MVSKFWEPLFSLMVLRIAFFMWEMTREPSFSPKVLVRIKCCILCIVKPRVTYGTVLTVSEEHWAAVGGWFSDHRAQRCLLGTC